MERGNVVEADEQERCREVSVAPRGELSISSWGMSRVEDAIDWERYLEL